MYNSQFEYDNATPSADQVGFLETDEGLDWLEASAQRLADGMDVTWRTKRGYQGVTVGDVAEAMACSSTYQAMLERWTLLRLRNTDDDAAERDGIESDLRKIAYAEAKSLLANLADDYAEHMRRESETDAQLAGVE